MRSFLSLLASLALLAACATPVQKATSGLQPLPEPPPPAPGAFDNIEAPDVTARKQDGDTIEEYRVGGRVVMIKVTPARGVPYILTDPRGDGSFSQRRDSLDVPLSVPMWILFTF